VFAGDKRAHFRLGILAGQDLQRPDPVDEPVHQSVGDLVTDRGDHGDGHASFPRGAVCRSHQGIHRLIEIRVGHYDSVVLRAAQGLNTLPM
jgi:hypothetical protein